MRKPNFFKYMAVLFILTASPVPVMANYYIDLFPAFVNAGDAKNQFGAGLCLGIDLRPDIRALIRFTGTIRDSHTVISSIEYDSKYSHSMILAGLEYSPAIAFLDRFRLKWRNTLMAGVSRTDIAIDSSPEIDADDSGLSVLIGTGLGYVITQHITLFLDGGWHQSFYSGDFSKSKIYGVQAGMGISYAFFSTRYPGDAY